VKGRWVELVAGDLSHGEGREQRGRNGARAGRCRSVNSCSLKRGRRFFSFLFANSEKNSTTERDRHRNSYRNIN